LEKNDKKGEKEGSESQTNTFICHLKKKKDADQRKRKEEIGRLRTTTRRKEKRVASAEKEKQVPLPRQNRAANLLQNVLPQSSITRKSAGNLTKGKKDAAVKINNRHT